MKTRPTGTLIASAVIISLLGLSFATSAGAETQFESSIVLSHGVYYFNYQEGGPGIGNAQESVSTGWVPTWGGYYDQSAEVAAEASASSGILRASARGSVRLNPICDPCSAGTAFATAKATALDSFLIQAGNGYANDDIVQVRVLAGLSGSVFLQGTPSGGNDWTFSVYFGSYPGSNELFNLYLYSGNLPPPYQATVGPTQWDQVVDVQVGRTYYLSGYLQAGERGSGFYGFAPGVYTDVVDFYNTGSLGLGYAPGYEDVVIVSAAGASIAPAPGFSFSLNKDLTPGCKSVRGTVTLTSPAPAEGVTITLSDTLASASTPATLRILPGATSRTFNVTTSPVVESESGTVSATLGGTTRSQNLTVRPMGLSSITLTPTSVAGGQPVTGTAKLECKAGPGAIMVDIASSNPESAYPEAANISVPVGVQSESFDVVTNSVLAKTTATISATANGITKSKTLTVTPAASVSPTSLRFANVVINTTSGVLSTTLSNKGTVAYVIDGITLTGTSAKYFAQTNDCPASLAAGASCTIGVTFTPTVTGSKSATLRIATSATATPLGVSLKGTGVLPP
jgi:hypothetical protein